MTARAAAAWLVVLAACGSPRAPVAARPPSRFAPGTAQLEVAIVELAIQSRDPRARRQQVRLTLRDAAGTVHVLYQRVVDGTCALADTRGRLDDPDADATLLAEVECTEAGGLVRVHAALEPDAVRVSAPEGPLEFATPRPFDVVLAPR